MLEQWEADQLLRVRKVYSHELLVDLGRGADDDYQVESVDGDAFFLLDVRGPGRNPAKARFQLRYRRSIVLARMCLTVDHTNPDGEETGFPHLHSYREDYDDKFTQPLAPYSSIDDAPVDFCDRINLPAPTIQGGVQ